MSQYNSLKATIDANVKQNGVQAITGQILNSVLNAMVNTLGTGYQFAGVATTATNPGSPDAKVFYIANGKGTYTNFGGLQVTEDDVVVLYWDSSWHKVSTGIASQAKLSELEGETYTTKDIKPDDVNNTYINASGVWKFASSTYDYRSVRIPVEAGQEVMLVRSASATSNSMRYAWLTSADTMEYNTNAVFADGQTTYMQTDKPSIILTAPSDATYLYVYYGIPDGLGGYGWMPESISMISRIKNTVAKLGNDVFGKMLLYSKTELIFNAANKWASSASYRTGYVQVAPNSAVKITSKYGTYATLSFVKNIPSVSGGDVEYADGWGRNQVDIAEGESRLLYAPNDAQYMVWIETKGANEQGQKIVAYEVDDSLEKDILTLQADIEELKNKPISSTAYGVGIFRDFGVIGASRDSGYIYSAKSGGTPQNINYLSWGANVCRTNGINFHCFAFGGATLKKWLSSNVVNKNPDGSDGNYGLAKMMADTPCDFYHIALGTNDTDEGLTYLGSISDMIDSDPSSCPDTFYGNYCRLVNKVREHAPSAKMVFCMNTGNNPTDVRIAYQNAVKAIAAHYGCPFMDFSDDIWYSTEMASDRQWGSHPTAVQLVGVAKSYERLFDKCVNENYNYFADYRHL